MIIYLFTDNSLIECGGTIFDDYFYEPETKTFFKYTNKTWYSAKRFLFFKQVSLHDIPKMNLFDLHRYYESKGGGYCFTTINLEKLIEKYIFLYVLNSI